MNYAADPKTYFKSFVGSCLGYIEDSIQSISTLAGFEFIQLQLFQCGEVYDAMLIYKIWGTDETK